MKNKCIDNQIPESEEEVFRFTGLDVKVVSDGIDISMEDYSQSLKDITDIRKVDDRKEELSKLEMKLYRKMTGKKACLANSKCFLIKGNKTLYRSLSLLSKGRGNPI